MPPPDKAVLTRSIRRTGWQLVFTRLGRYFFFKPLERLSLWIPSKELLEHLLALPDDQLHALFDPYTEPAEEEPDALEFDTFEGEEAEEKLNAEDEELNAEDEERSRSEPKEDETDKDPHTQNDKHMASIDLPPPPLTGSKPTPLSKETAVAEREGRIQNFIEMLHETEIDPFRPWEEIVVSLASDPRFHALKSAKDRQATFDLVCPELVARRRHEQSVQLDDARAAWQRCLERMHPARTPATWTEFSRTVKREPWFKLLDPRELEKQFRARLAQLKARHTYYAAPQ